MPSWNHVTQASPTRMPFIKGTDHNKVLVIQTGSVLDSHGDTHLPRIQTRYMFIRHKLLLPIQVLNFSLDPSEFPLTGSPVSEPQDVHHSIKVEHTGMGCQADIQSGNGTTLGQAHMAFPYKTRTRAVPNLLDASYTLSDWTRASML